MFIECRIHQCLEIHGHFYRMPQPLVKVTRNTRKCIIECRSHQCLHTHGKEYRMRRHRCLEKQRNVYRMPQPSVPRNTRKCIIECRSLQQCLETHEKVYRMRSHRLSRKTKKCLQYVVTISAQKHTKNYIKLKTQEIFVKTLHFFCLSL